MTKIYDKFCGSRSLMLIAFFAFIIAASFTSCTSPQKLRYFSNLSDSQLVRLPQLAKPEAVIMPDDILEIKVGGANETTVATINSYSNPNNPTPVTYIVDKNGEVEFPLIGKITAGGLTRNQFKESLEKRVSKYLKDPIVTVKFTSFRFTVLGEVNAPGTYVVPNEKVTILEAMGHAKDMTEYARRTNVRVIRDSSGAREIGIINFNDKAVFTSPYYYLQRNDVVYIEPERNKGRIDQASRIGSIAATLLSIIAVTLTIFK
jgi:polysaccharide biosynthesis/export protein